MGDGVERMEKMMEKFTERFDKKLAEVKLHAQAAKPDLSERAKKARTPTGHVWARPGCEQQYKRLEAQAQQLEAAEQALPETFDGGCNPETTTRVAEFVNAGLQLTYSNMALQKLADKEGWEVAQAYENGTAQGLSSDDEKKLERARKSVAAQKADREKAPSRKRQAPPAERFSSQASFGQPQVYQHQQPMQYGGYGQQYGAPMYAQQGYPYNLYSANAKAKNLKPKECFKCGIPGHFQADCPNQAAVQTYPAPMMAPGPM